MMEERKKKSLNNTSRGQSTTLFIHTNIATHSNSKIQRRIYALAKKPEENKRNLMLNL